jgi:hypothetical protein
MEARLARSSHQRRSHKYRHRQNQIESLPVFAAADAGSSVSTPLPFGFTFAGERPPFVLAPRLRPRPSED